MKKGKDLSKRLKYLKWERARMWNYVIGVDPYDKNTPGECYVVKRGEISLKDFERDSFTQEPAIGPGPESSLYAPAGPGWFKKLLVDIKVTIIYVFSRGLLESFIYREYKKAFKDKYPWWFKKQFER